ncbi:hypothetical protein ACSBR1_014047 [Camellia fascicularis]
MFFSILCSLCFLYIYIYSKNTINFSRYFRTRSLKVCSLSLSLSSFFLCFFLFSGLNLHLGFRLSSRYSLLEEAVRKIDFHCQ